MKRNKAASLLLAVVLLAGCMGQVHVQHPGAVNAFDSTTYDVLLGVKAVIDTAREQHANGTLAAGLVPLVDRLSVAYNRAYPAWKAWRDAMQTNGAPPARLLTSLQQDMVEVSTALERFKKGK